MDELRPDALAAEVAAWHNRHPLARRITPAQVQGIGWVALPFVQRPGAAPLAAPEGAVPVLVSSVDAPSASGQAAAPRLRDRAQAQAQAQTHGQAPAPGVGAPSGAAAPSSFVQRLQAAARQALQRVVSLPGRLQAGWQARRQQHTQWRLRQRSLKPAFSEDFIAPLSPRQVARWALRHGLLHARSAQLPVREVRPDAKWGRQDTGLVTLYLATAAVEVGSRRARVLLPAAGGRGHTLGPRLMSPQRTAAALGVLAVLGLGIARPSVPPPADWPGVAAAQAVLARWSALAGGAGGAGEGAHTADAAMAAASAADGASAASADSSASAAEDAATAAWAAADAALLAEHAARAASEASAADPSASAAAAANPAWAEANGAAPPPSPPVADAAAAARGQALAQAGPGALQGADPDGGASTLPPDDPPPAPPAEPFRPGQRLVRPLDEATKAAAREKVAALRAARGDPAPAAPAAPAAPGPLALAPMPPAPAADTAALGPAYALTTRPLRTRAESEQVQAAVRALLAQISTEPMLVELMPAGDDWRVVCWPFARREDAQLARALLLTRGLRLEAVEF